MLLCAREVVRSCINKASDHILHLDTAASRTYLRTDSRNKTHEASEVKRVRNRSVTCANGSTLETTHKGKNGELQVSYLAGGLHGDLVSIGEVCDNTNKQFIFESRGAYLPINNHRVNTDDTTKFAKISDRSPGSVSNYGMTIEQANEFLGTRYFASHETANKSMHAPSERTLQLTSSKHIKRRYHRKRFLL